MVAFRVINRRSHPRAPVARRHRNGELAAITSWSPPQVSQVLQAFDANNWTGKWGPQRGPRARRELADLDGLLEAWAGAVSRQQEPTRFAERSFRDAMSFLHNELAEALDAHVTWAATGWAAAQELAPFTTTVPTLQLYVASRDFTGPLSQALRQANITEVGGAARLEFRRAPDAALTLVRRMDGIPLASAPRVFADLRALGGRAGDAADHLRAEVINPMHRPSAPRSISADLAKWAESCHARLDRSIANLDRPALAYAHGTWSFAYSVATPSSPVSLTRLRDLLEEAHGAETGWPPWWVPTRADIKPKIVDGGIECWFRDHAIDDPAHADYWRAEPTIRLCLIRGYQEDAITGDPGAKLDLTLPIWRVGECLLHAARMTKLVQGRKIKAMVRWTGLEGRELSTVAARDRFLAAGRRSSTDVLATYIETTHDDIANRLPSLVQALVSPVFELFDFFEPPLALYGEELTDMQRRVR